MKTRRKKYKFKIKNIIILFIVIISIVIISSFTKKEEKIVLLTNYDGMNINEVKKYVSDNKLQLEEEYQYSENIDKDLVISSLLENNLVKVTVSLGTLDDSVYIENKVNELGKVPIMMYHGIIDTVDNKYTGGNVDKDGYNRTAKAFGEDLEFYYQQGYRMIRLTDYVNGIIDVPLGKSPIILTFDDGNQNNFNVLGIDENGNLEIDPNCAVGILESFKAKYPDYNVTATFFVNGGIFNQSKYNEQILDWLIEHGYDVGNHTISHVDFTKIGVEKTQMEVGKLYKMLDDYIPGKYVKIIALPFGTPYKDSHPNYPYILKGIYNGYSYETEAALRVGWEPEVSPFSKDFDIKFLKRCRAYDNNGKDFDITMVFKNLEKNRYISDGDKNLIVIPSDIEKNMNSNYTNIHTYEKESL